MNCKSIYYRSTRSINKPWSLILKEVDNVRKTCQNITYIEKNIKVQLPVELSGGTILCLAPDTAHFCGKRCLFCA